MGGELVWEVKKLPLRTVPAIFPPSSVVVMMMVASARAKCWRKKKVVVFASEGAIKSYPTDMKVCDSSRATCDKHVVINKH